MLEADKFMSIDVPRERRDEEAGQGSSRNGSSLAFYWAIRWCDEHQGLKLTAIPSPPTHPSLFIKPDTANHGSKQAPAGLELSKIPAGPIARPVRSFPSVKHWPAVPSHEKIRF